ncbi:hypothetical protein DM01DRAFT_1332614 [Hesseltinella vesiculosa]|uniref:RING-type E3 ubiquitin transferase n=1 Tax=Hesseltinella vesiculosa TaxID=101127 RepID=A0A1X2GTW2_9FUNG|nr:hypothetical protein DM01DRAFT_1332614 [Hesseltinella vesiculosa]
MRGECMFFCYQCQKKVGTIATSGADTRCSECLSVNIDRIGEHSDWFYDESSQEDNDRDDYNDEECESANEQDAAYNDLSHLMSTVSVSSDPGTDLDHQENDSPDEDDDEPVSDDNDDQWQDMDEDDNLDSDEEDEAASPFHLCPTHASMFAAAFSQAAQTATFHTSDPRLRLADFMHRLYSLDDDDDYFEDSDYDDDDDEDDDDEEEEDDDDDIFADEDGVSDYSNAWDQNSNGDSHEDIEELDSLDDDYGEMGNLGGFDVDTDLLDLLNNEDTDDMAWDELAPSYEVLGTTLMADRSDQDDGYLGSVLEVVHREYEPGPFEEHPDFLNGSIYYEEEVVTRRHQSRFLRLRLRHIYSTMETNSEAEQPRHIPFENLSSRTLHDQDHLVTASVDCIICQETYQTGKLITKMPCGHEYHDECIRHWLNHNITCPVCRRSLQEVDSVVS